MIRRLVLMVVLIAVAAGSISTAAAQADRRPMIGRPLRDVLLELQRRGLRVLFSSELVRDDMRVQSEPAPASDRHVLDALLAPHDLAVRPGPGNTLLVIRAPRPVPASPGPVAPAAVPTPSVRGIVVDARTAAPLSGVRVRIAGGTVEGVTDADGRFELAPVAAGEHTLAASLVGYALARPQVTVGETGAADIAIALADGTGAYGEQITVTGDRFRGAEASVPSAMALTSTDLLELRGVFTDDPLRAAQVLPSVMTGTDHRSEFSVRGSDYRHIGLSVDGVAIGWPIHTVRDDLSGGSVALINGDVLDSMTLASGGYPQERPSTTGAWLDMTVREGSRTATEAHGAVGMASASLVLEGPIGSSGRGSWLVSGRQSYLQWILARMDVSGTHFGFSDAQGKLVYDVTPRQRLQVTFLAGRSLLDQSHAQPEPNQVQRGTANTTFVATAWQSTFGSSSSLNQTLAVSNYGFENDSALGPVLTDGSGRWLSYRGTLGYALRTRTMLRAGVHVERRNAQEFSTQYIGFSGEDNWVPRQEVIDGTRTELASFGRISHTLGERLSIDGGVLFTHEPSSAASPWLTMSVPVGPLTVRAGGGVYRQMPELEHTIGSFGDPDIQPERSRHLEAAVEHAWGPGLRWQVSAYQREERDILHLDDNDYIVVDGELLAPSMTPRWRNALRGSARGVEVLLQRRSASGLSGWISYAWSRTDYEDTASGERFDGDFDQRHTFSAYGLYRLSPVTSINAKFRYGSNFPIPGYFVRQQGDFYVGSARNTERLPSYARVDVRANRAFNFDRRRLTLFVEVVNLFGRTNHAADVPHVWRSGRVFSATQSLFPFLPTAGIQIDF